MIDWKPCGPPAERYTRVFFTDAERDAIHEAWDADWGWNNVEYGLDRTSYVAPCCFAHFKVHCEHRPTRFKEGDV